MIRRDIPCYANGLPYRAAHSPHCCLPRPRDCRRDQIIALTSPSLTWARLWQIASAELSRRGYGAQTVQMYRWVLRRFLQFSRRRPSCITPELVKNYLGRLAEEETSWNWIGMNISVLRTVFDKLGGLSVTRGLRTPKRPRRLPEILSREEALRLLAAAPSTRAQMLLGLLYGCGLKVGEACRMKWQDVDVLQQRLRVSFARGSRERFLEIPPDLLPVLRLGVKRCAPGDYVFQGRQAGKPLSVRAAELIVRKARESAGIIKPVTAMSLRHAFAVHCLENAESIRAVQEALGHKSVETTRVYEECVVPESVVSPIDRLKRRQEPKSGAEPNRPAEPPKRSEPVNGELFEAPLDIEPLDLPFRDNTSFNPISLATDFYRMLRTHVVHRFLGMRRASRPPG